MPTRLSERLGAPVTEDDVLDSPHAFIGSVDSLVEKIHRLRDELNISYLALSGNPEELSSIVGRLAGT